MSPIEYTKLWVSTKTAAFIQFLARDQRLGLKAGDLGEEIVHPANRLYACVVARGLRRLLQQF